jgi:hypothetical protein
VQLSQATQEELTEHIERFFILRSLSESVEGLAEAVEWIEGSPRPQEIPIQNLLSLLEQLPSEILKILDNRVRRLKKAGEIDHVQIAAMRSAISCAIRTGLERAEQHRKEVASEIEWLHDSSSKAFNPHDKWSSFSGLSYEQTQQLASVIKVSEPKKE